MFFVKKYKDLRVYFPLHLDGGGSLFAFEFVQLISGKVGKVEHLFEYCAGPGFIGFCLLAYNLCDRLTLADINPAAVECVKYTIKKNHLEDRVTVYKSDALKDIPRHEQWDVVVANPPWIRVHHKKQRHNILIHDEQNKVHKNFYEQIDPFLKPKGSIFFIESAWFSTAESHRGLIESHGFQLVEASSSRLDEQGNQGPKQETLMKRLWVLWARCMMFVLRTYFLWTRKK